MNSKIENAFNEIKADEMLKQQTLKKIVGRNKKATISPLYKLLPLAAAVALMMLSGVYFTPTSYISIDINPSIELEVNSFNRVIAVTASNEDAEDIVKSVHLKNLSYIDAMEALESSKGFKENVGDYTEITVLANDNEGADIMIANINQCSFGENDNVKCFSANNETKEQAEELNISFGKYRAFLELQEVNPKITIEEIRDLPMRVIRDMIDNEGNPTQSQGGNGNGNGKKYRHNQP